MENKSYMPIEVFCVERFINQQRSLKCSYFEFDKIVNGYGILGSKIEKIVYFDFMLEFNEDEEDMYYQEFGERELYYYVPFKFIVSIDKSNDISKEKIKKLVTKKMFEIKNNIDSCLEKCQNLLIIKDRIIQINI